jgi:NitT/TauT family transport system permease protein
LLLLAAMSLLLFQAVVLTQKLLFPWSLPKNG